MKKTVKKCAAALRIDAATNSQEKALADALSSTMQRELKTRGNERILVCTRRGNTGPRGPAQYTQGIPTPFPSPQPGYQGIERERDGDRERDRERQREREEKIVWLPIFAQSAKLDNFRKLTSFLLSIFFRQFSF